MLKSLRTAESGMNIQLTRTNVLANNLANVDATGFKQMLVQVAERQVSADGGKSLPAIESGEAGLPPTPAFDPVRDVVLDCRAPIDMTQGRLRPTGHSTDVALDGDGLFKVSRDGREYYTRNGSFTLDANRRLTTSTGDPVLGAGGAIEIPEGELLIDPDGVLSVDGAEVGRLAVVAFDDPGVLSHLGEGLMSASAEAKPRKLAAGDYAVRQGMLEGSNVNPIDTLVAMISAQRAFEIESKTIQAADNTLDKSINELGRKV